MILKKFRFWFHNYVLTAYRRRHGVDNVGRRLITISPRGLINQVGSGRAFVKILLRKRQDDNHIRYHILAVDKNQFELLNKAIPETKC